MGVGRRGGRKKTRPETKKYAALGGQRFPPAVLIDKERQKQREEREKESLRKELKELRADSKLLADIMEESPKEGVIIGGRGRRIRTLKILGKKEKKAIEERKNHTLLRNQ